MITIKDILPIWWAWQWRSIVGSAIGIAVFSFIIGFVGSLLGFSKEIIYILSNLASIFITIYASIYFFAYVFNKDFKKYRVVLIEKSKDLAKKAALI